MLVGLKHVLTKQDNKTGIKRKFYILVTTCVECGKLCSWSNFYGFFEGIGGGGVQYWDIARVKCCKCNSCGWECSYCEKR